MFRPKFKLNSKIVKALMDAEASRQAVGSLPLSVELLESLRKSARLLSTHYSTQIEGNLLSASQVEQVLAGGGRFPGRKRDEAEVKNYYSALEFVEVLGREKKLISERSIQTIHGLVVGGKKKPTPYRDGQNVIRDGRSGGIIYLPPEAHDVPELMSDLVSWVNRQMMADDLPVPVIAGLVHCQFATIHPYYDGNGRTARLLTTLILHRGGYGLGGIYSLEEYYAQNLAGYYQALSIGKSHNYYLGRATADVTRFLDYFCRGLADSFAKVRVRAEETQSTGRVDQTQVLRSLTAQQRAVLTLFVRNKTVMARDVARFFRMKPRSAAALCRRWLDDGFVIMANASKKARCYQLAGPFESFVSATDPLIRVDPERR